ncbi:hypothetical protein BJ138DRAFT_304184 [Hygrophoropsis aurantiaca]|uniref:Uncharacterized protein n=1 Tax=Hygrophoropsis aurantiaca TaxID=72124 RepID=A0ACB8A6Q6_9AGAM|nr:hypothetical protein BJ138DRAFT_304184 [Hygrophoropsis aurantiaca]
MITVHKTDTSRGGFSVPSCPSSNRIWSWRRTISVWEPSRRADCGGSGQVTVLGSPTRSRKCSMEHFQNTREPGEWRMPFGRYEGRTIEEVPTSYLRYMMNTEFTIYPWYHWYIGAHQRYEASLHHNAYPRPETIRLQTHGQVIEPTDILGPRDDSEDSSGTKEDDDDSAFAAQ